MIVFTVNDGMNTLFVHDSETNEIVSNKEIKRMFGADKDMVLLPDMIYKLYLSQYHFIVNLQLENRFKSGAKVTLGISVVNDGNVFKGKIVNILKDNTAPESLMVHTGDRYIGESLAEVLQSFRDAV